MLEAREGTLEEAGRSFARAVEVAPEETPALANLATFYEQQGRREDAARLYERVLARDPTDVIAARRLAALRSQPDAVAPAP